MHERIIDLIIFFVTELRAKKTLKDIDTSSLRQRGYSLQEISTAFSWVHERLTSGEPTQLTSAIARQSFRVLNDAERTVIEQEALGYLIQCHQLGLISNEEVEVLIDRCMSSNNETISLADMKYFVGSTVVENAMSKNVHSRTIFENPDSIH